MTTDESKPAVFYDPASGKLNIGGLKTSDKAVLREAARWSTGERGDPVDLADLRDVDLSAFAREALSVGARVLALAAQDGDTRAVRQAVKEASEQVNDLVSRVSESSDAAVRRAVDSMTAATRHANEEVMAQVTRLVGGENPELAERLRPILDRVGTNMEAQVAEAISKATEAQRTESERRHTELVRLMTDVQREVAVRVAEEDAAAAVRGVTTIKGFDYEEQLHALLTEIAAGIGDEYEETGDTAGRLPRNKKGDGVFHVNGGAARLVVEAHDGSAKEWGSYLAEAERNRGASAAIGLVRRVEDNAGHTVRVIAQKRLVVAFDPATDDPELLRTAILLMRTVALTASGRSGAEEVATANEHIREALEVLAELDEAKRSASAINGHVEKIERVVTKSMTAIQRELNGALNALTGSAAPGSQQTPLAAVTDGGAPAQETA
ncbi:hypothetical protein [Nocardioides pakistanensis]